ncbi:Permease of the drug/metabolite transporter (DMT) superfamily [Roseivivax lentus]|uniref:Permease of the drug/metabolite transporter (DMT) superfamily n=1 Tax=Roseivivax lentus TaxID=633194 RepID=A0A1N7MQD8_9RHOB|nr:DMT family transporter [Roseivivax lentus]SIS88270.1 Permease of the drug/metabolite transporter (DMT) superfamily [Roseivivax lentus]
MIPQTSISGRAWAELALLSLIWGGSFLAIRTALNEIGPVTAVAFRVMPAATALWLYTRLRGIPAPRDPRLWAAALMMGALNNVLPFTLMAWGQLHVSTGLTSILNAATAVWGALLAALVFTDERMTTRKALGIALGFGGVALAIGPGALTAFNLESLGQLAIVAGTLSYAVASLWARRFLRGTAPEMAACLMLTGSSVLILPAMLMTEGVPSLDLAPVTWAAILYYALVATAFAYLLYYRILAMAGASNLMLVTLLIPPVAIILGAVVRAETLSANAFAGFALLALGLVVLDGRLSGRIRGRDARRV